MKTFVNLYHRNLQKLNKIYGNIDLDCVTKSRRRCNNHIYLKIYFSSTTIMLHAVKSATLSGREYTEMYFDHGF